ncbi:MAG: antitoxin [Clostridia bacterium]|nr:antitoxin [Clostridia bacterium]
MVKMTANELMQPLTEEELREIEETENRELVFDADSPEMSVAQLNQFRRMYSTDRSKQTVSLRLSRNTYNKARTYGKGYTSFLSRLLDAAINDEELVKKCV